MALEIFGEPSEPLPDRPAWRWLLHRWWMVLAGVAAGAILAFLLGARSPASYAAEALVTGSGEVAAEDFGDLAEQLVGTDTVLQPVIEELGLDTTPEALLTEGRIEAHAVTGSSSVRVIARSNTREGASALALAVADSFARAAQNRSLGTFQVFGTAGTVQGGPISPIGWAVGGGILGGILMAIGLLVAGFLRQPILTIEEAEAETRTDTSFMVRLRRGGRKEWELYPHGVTPAIWRSLHLDPKERRPVCIVLVERRRRSDPEIRQVAAELTAEAKKARAPQLALLRVRSGEVEPVRADAPETLAVASAIVGVVAAGAKRDSVRALEEAATALGSPSQKRILIFVAKGKGRTGRREAAPRLALPSATVLEPNVAGPSKTEEPSTAAPEEAAEAVPPAASDEAAPLPAPPVPSTSPAPANGDGRGPAVGVPDTAPAPAPPSQRADAPSPNGPPHEESAEFPELEAEDAAARLRALEALLAEPDPRALGAVRDRLRDPDPTVRSLAVSVLASIQAARARR